jgi:hypothetical protein
MSKQAYLLLILAVFGFLSSAHAADASPDSMLKAQRLYRRLTGVPLNPSDQRLSQMASLIENGDAEKAAAIATDDPYFYQVTVKDMAALMSNRTETPFVGLDDFQATFIGAVRDDLDARTLLTGNYIYRARPHIASSEPSRSSNDHYKDIDSSPVDYQSALVKQEPQWPGVETYAGLLTTRAWAIAHYDAGTNRRAVVYAIQEFLCTPIDAWKTAHLPDIYVGRDVDRCSGGKWDPNQKRCVGEANTKVFQDQCRTCHAGMDAMRGAFSRMDSLNGSFVELPKGRPAPKYRHNSGNYPDGYVTTDDGWENLISQNSVLGFDSQSATTGKGLNYFAQMLTQTSAFKTCMAQRVFTQVCGRAVQPSDQATLKSLGENFAKNGFDLKKLFQETAIRPECMGE